MPNNETAQKPAKDATPTEAEKKALRAKMKAKLAQILDRGMVASRLDVKDADPSRHYEWARNTETDISRYQSLGFRVEFEKGKGLHGKGDNRRIIGDAILMSCSKENFEILEEIKEERHERRRRIDAKKDYVKKSKMRNPVVPVLDPLNVGDSAE